jgi:hypothetical protein
MMFSVTEDYIASNDPMTVNMNLKAYRSGHGLICGTILALAWKG